MNNLNEKQRNWVDKTLAVLSLEKQVAQLLHPVLTVKEDGLDQRVKEIIGLGIGGAFQGDISSLEKLLEVRTRIDDNIEIPLIVSGDYECGPRFPESPSFGSAMTLAGIADLDEAAETAYKVGKWTAYSGRQVGTRWTFSPVVDINFNPDNPITNIRSFGDDKERISILTKAYVKGLQEHGMAATLKHFPGDGMDDRDQHICTSENALSLEEWQQTFGETFRAGFSVNAWSVMMGHISFPVLSGRNPDNGQYLPGTLDPAIHQFLRDLGFAGLIISDALGMGGIASHCPDKREMAVRNLMGGSDMVLFPDDLPGTIEAIVQAVKDGRLSGEKIRNSCRKVLSLKAMTGLDSSSGLPDAESVREFCAQEKIADLAKNIARKSITCLQNFNGDLPVNLPDGGKVVILDMPYETPDGVQFVVANQEEGNRKQLDIHKVLAEQGYLVTTLTTLDGFADAVKDADLLVYHFNSFPQAGRGNIRQCYQSPQFIEQTRHPIGLKRVYICLGNPYLLREFPFIPNFVCGYGRGPEIARSAVDAITGAIPFAGVSPVKIFYTNSLK